MTVPETKSAVAFNTVVKKIIWGRSLPRTLLRAGILAVSALVIFKFLFLPVRVSGLSMEPTYHDGSVNFVNTLRYCRQRPQRGDVVAIRMAGRHVMLLKRIIGLPGESLVFRQGKLIINNEVVVEPYLRKGCDWEMAEVVIGADEFFVAGDNRSMALEAHTHGRVEQGRIIGGPLF